ncbi:MAG TPA: EamA family transporter [Planktothrix sp.]|jgi:drug/metabolite transporter (DMT)-like permease
MLKLQHAGARVWAGLWLAIALDTGVQIFWKIAVLKVPPDADTITTAIDVLKQPLFYGVIAMFFAQLFNWLKVLGEADLSYAQPITSLSYVSVGICSALFLHEYVTVAQGIGIALILTGVWFISQTEHQSVAEKLEGEA